MDKLKIEAIKRMNQLKIKNNIVDYFKDEDIVYVSDFNNLLNSYPISNNKNYKNIVEDFEKATGHKVYHALRTHTYFGEILDLLFVSKYEEDWEYDFIKNNNSYFAMSMANNLTDENCSDMGTIIVRNKNGILERIG